ncbi:MAG TPA: hypothetical protein EYO01_03830 [Phycisphaerales bacterium]|nr:hypothetical protein [Phycisphaerales bacterium]HIB50362.1 hypothetical protein [Phycisphaerales bacterium]HIN83358.1 hypothetical protein [Phycisphaerales bacterium]HIO20230.1 hypothetical protein [Phycisphaerales bacterium]HIO52126.1 hypothetical protein [Phycisphaerales bacterium]
MDKRSQWIVFRGRLLVIVGVASLLVAMFLPEQIPEPLSPLVIVFGVGFIALAVPWRIWKNVPTWFHRDDTWL